MNRKVIYVDFVFKRKKLSSKTTHFIYKIKLKIKNFLNNLFKTKKLKSNFKIYPFKKVL